MLDPAWSRILRVVLLAAADLLALWGAGAAAYLLWALKRILYGPLTSDENRALKDLTPREYLVLAPLIALIVWIGLYPQPILRRMDNAAQTYIQIVQSRVGNPDMASREQR